MVIVWSLFFQRFPSIDYKDLSIYILICNYLSLYGDPRGPEGSSVELTIRSGSEIKHLSLT